MIAIRASVLPTGALTSFPELKPLNQATKGGVMFRRIFLMAAGLLAPPPETRQRCDGRLGSGIPRRRPGCQAFFILKVFIVGIRRRISRDQRLAADRREGVSG